MFEEGTFDILNILSSFKTLETLEEQLNYILVMLYSLDADSQQLFEAEILKFEGIFSNIPFMRQVRYRDSLVKDYKSEYFGKDYSADDPFLYMPKLEEDISKISMEIMAVIGRVVKVMNHDNINLGDES